MHVLQRCRNTVCWNVSSHKEKHEKQYSRCSAACARIHFNGFAFLHTPRSRVESHPRQGDESRGRAELLHFTFRSRAENRSRATPWFPDGSTCGSAHPSSKASTRSSTTRDTTFPSTRCRASRNVVNSSTCCRCAATSTR